MQLEKTIFVLAMGKIEVLLIAVGVSFAFLEMSIWMLTLIGANMVKKSFSKEEGGVAE